MNITHELVSENLERLLLLVSLAAGIVMLVEGRVDYALPWFCAGLGWGTSTANRMLLKQACRERDEWKARIRGNQK